MVALGRVGATLQRDAIWGGEGAMERRDEAGEKVDEDEDSQRAS